MDPLTQPPTPPEPRTVSELLGALGKGGPTLVAMSGGVDSSVVALLAHRALGPLAYAATLASPAVSPREVERSREVARAIGIAHVVLTADPLSVGEYRANPTNRCYFCRRTEAGELRRWGAAHGIHRYVDGVHLDDLADDRPGLAAMAEAGFEHPLLVGGWRKADVRAFAHEAGLPNWDQPSDACLASRVRHGVPIDAGLLDRVRRAEERLLDRGFRRVRVRTDGRSARVVVDAAEVPRLTAEPLATVVLAELKDLGFADVVLDADGYRPRPGL